MMRRFSNGFTSSLPMMILTIRLVEPGMQEIYDIETCQFFFLQVIAFRLLAQGLLSDGLPRNRFFSVKSRITLMTDSRSAPTPKSQVAVAMSIK